MIIICDPDAQLRERLATASGATTTGILVASTDEAEGTLQEAGAATVVTVLGPGIHREDALRFAEKVDEHHGGVATLLVADELDPQLLREALRSGIDDVLTIDASDEEWTEAVNRARARVASEVDHVRPEGAPSTEGAPGRLVTVFSTKGGCGKSLVASNLAILAAEQMQTTVPLVDLDLQSGDLAIMLQLMPALSIYDAAQAAGRLDIDALSAHLTPHRSGVALLAAPMEPSLAEQVTAPAVTRILELLKAAHPLTVLDGPALFTDQVLAAIDLSDQIVLVGSMDVPSIKNLRLAMNTLSQLGHPRDQLRLVLNRADTKVGLRSSEVEKSLGASIDVMIPSSRDVPLSVNQGTPLAASRPKSPVVAAIRELLPDIVPAKAGEGETRRRRRR